jgi:signal transduction histidine kinase
LCEKNVSLGKKDKMLDLHRNQSVVKTILAFLAFLIGITSVFYTNHLVSQLTEREERLIDLYAKAQAFAANSTGGGDLNFVMTEIIRTNNFIPVIQADDKDIPLSHLNVALPEGLTPAEEEQILIKKIKEIKKHTPPIVIHLDENWKQYIYYENSALIEDLRFYPYWQLGVIAVLGLLTYLIFSATRRSEQNRVWVGLAKETAHQLGTPISGLMAWIEYLRLEPSFDQSIADEMQKDVERLNTITARFSNIGSQPSLKNENIGEIVSRNVLYLSGRISGKVKISYAADTDEPIFVSVSKTLFEWVIENLCKNAADAMKEGGGKIDIFIHAVKFPNHIIIDVADNGKGIAAKDVKRVFDPGFTTKKRGWGLGLTLVKRIIENYHKGKIFVLHSEPNVGTTFRIYLPKNEINQEKIKG